MNKQKNLRTIRMIVFVVLAALFACIWCILKSYFHESMKNNMFDIFFMSITTPYLDTLSEYLIFLFVQKTSVKIYENKKSEFTSKRFSCFIRRSVCYVIVIWITQSILFKESFNLAEIIMCFVTVGINWLTSKYSTFIEMEPVLLSDEYYITGMTPKEVIIGGNNYNDISEKAKSQPSKN